MTDCETEDEQIILKGSPRNFSRNHLNFARLIGADPDRLLSSGHSLRAIKPSCPVYKKLDAYLKNGHCPTHKFQMRTLRIYKVSQTRAGRKETRAGLNVLLWHGTSQDNVGSILMNGFQKPELKGQMYGSGIYFADRASKSANYTGKPSPGQSGLLLLCNVYLGKVFQAHHALLNSESAPRGFDTVQGLGKQIPDPRATGTHRGMKIPIGQTVERPNSQQLALLYNEYIVYQPAHIAVEYVLQFEFGIPRSGIGFQIQDTCGSCGNCGRRIPSTTTKAVLSNGKEVCESCQVRSGTGRLCGTCKKTIGTEHGIIFQNSLLHMSCFNCAACRGSLANQYVYVQSDRNYCEPCHSRLFLPKCTKCRLVIKGEYTTYESKAFHSECFCCSKCGKSIGSKEKVWPQEGRIFCEPCFNIQFGKACFKCKSVIELTKDPGTTFKGNPWHTQCLVCSGPCAKTLTGQHIYSKTVNEQEKQFCEICYYRAFGKKCHHCSVLIKGPFTTFDKRDYHVNCFVCSGPCRKGLSGKQIYSGTGTALGRHFCESCYYNAFGKRCQRCSNLIKGEYSTYKGHNYHKACFICRLCQTPIGNETFNDTNGICCLKCSTYRANNSKSISK